MQRVYTFPLQYVTENLTTEVKIKNKFHFFDSSSDGFYWTKFEIL